MADRGLAPRRSLHSLNVVVRLRFIAVRRLGLLAAVALLIPSAGAQTLAPDDLAAARNYYLNDLITLPDYSPGKNSFLFHTCIVGIEKLCLISGATVRSSTSGRRGAFPAMTATFLLPAECWFVFFWMASRSRQFQARSMNSIL